MSVNYRRATPDDRVFVISNWVASFRTAHAAGLIPMKVWHGRMWEDAEWMIDKEAVETLVAEEDGTLYGFLVHEPAAPRARWRVSAGSSGSLDNLPYIYFAYTKEYRRRGRQAFGVAIMSGLVDAADIDLGRQFGYACKTTSVIQLLDAGKIPGARWDPLRARYERETRETTR
ncbi:MAG TPA: hypothetical protein VJU58_06165 [Microbacterium sp.]|nr:hypothetical protein [Microbacterium sp.]